MEIVALVGKHFGNEINDENLLMEASLKSLFGYLVMIIEIDLRFMMALMESEFSRITILDETNDLE
jgi:hypothetical protein